MTYSQMMTKEKTMKNLRKLGITPVASVLQMIFMVKRYTMTLSLLFYNFLRESFRIIHTAVSSTCKYLTFRDTLLSRFFCSDCGFCFF